MRLIIPEGYRNLLGNVENTEKAIKSVKDMFQQNLSAQLALLRVTAPMVVLSGTGLNDELNGVERPVSFPIRDMDERRAEVVHSLAKWKRLKLAGMRWNVPTAQCMLTIRARVESGLWDEVVDLTMRHYALQITECAAA